MVSSVGIFRLGNTDDQRGEGSLKSTGGGEITLLSPESPLYRALVGKKAGDTLDAPPFQVRGVS